VASATPSREEITSAYQNALQSRAPAAAPAVVPPQVTVAVASPAPAPQARRMDADELATLMKRAKESLASGDIPVARLLLERAADGQDAGAALMLAQTYDPAVLGTSDVRNITPEPDKARNWYQRAAQLGSADAQRRLAQMQN
jgi:TPR repeat protein